MKIANS